jgi:hypothetical protein
MTELKDGESNSRGYDLYSGYNIYLQLYSLFNIYTLMNYKFSSHFFSGAIIIFLSRIKTNMI